MAGRPPRVPDAALLAAVVTADQPCVGTADVAAQVSLSYQGTKDRLDDLAAAGLVDYCEIGPARAWWLTPAGCERVHGE